MKASALFAAVLAAAQKNPEGGEMSAQDRADAFHADAEESVTQDALSTPYSCYSGDSSEYIGLASTTASGKQCQNWLDTFPVKIPSEKMPQESFTDHNYCRQLENGKEPVCYPLSGSADAGPEGCAVMKCPKDDTVDNMKAARDELIVALGEPDGADTNADQNCKCADALFGSSTSMSDTSVGFIQTRMGKMVNGKCQCE